MNEPELAGLLDFLRTAERLKTVTRSGYTSAGHSESVAEHTWRLSLMALLLAPEFPELDAARLLKICLVHDLGEAIGGDIPAPEQARRAAAGETGKSQQERRDLEEVLRPLAARQRAEILALWDEYDAARSPEAKLAKALDRRPRPQSRPRCFLRNAVVRGQASVIAARFAASTTESRGVRGSS